MMKNKRHHIILNLKTIFYALFLMLVLSACQKDIDIKLPKYQEKLVVEASIEPGQPATVFLSITAPFFGGADFSDPTKYFVKGAFITVTDGNMIDTLVEAVQGKGYFYFGTKVFGHVGGNYLLSINVNDKQYTSFTTILNPIPLDSAYFKGEKDSLGFCWGHLTEPAGQGNNYRWLAKRITKDQFFAAPFNSAFDDKFIDGKSFEFSYERPPQPNQQQANENDPEAGFYKQGDTIIVKFCTIGNNEYLFWRSYYANKASNGNPFAAPSNLQSNITGNNVIGAFCGYGTSFDTVIVKKNP
jgi:hypothetical protein